MLTARERASQQAGGHRRVIQQVPGIDREKIPAPRKRNIPPVGRIKIAEEPKYLTTVSTPPTQLIVHPIKGRTFSTGHYGSDLISFVTDA